MKRSLIKFIALMLTPIIFLSAPSATANALRPASAVEKNHLPNKYAALNTVGLIGIGVQGRRLLAMLARNGSGVNVRAVDRYKERSYLDEVSVSAGKEMVNASNGKCGLLEIKMDGPEAVLNDPLVKAVIVATPSDTHYDLVNQALLAGKHVLVEKPFVLKADQARELTALARKKGLVLMVGHVLYYSQNFQRLKNIVDSGILGNITGIEAELSNVRDRKRAYSANALEDLGYHLLYMSKGLFSGSPRMEIITAERFRDSEFGDYEHYEMLIKCGPALLKLKANRDHKNHQDPQNVRIIKVRGTAFTATLDFSKDPGFIFINQYGEDFSPTDFAKAKEMALSAPGAGEWKYNTPLDVEVRAFFDAILGEGPNQSSGALAVPVVELIELANSLLSDSLKFTKPVPPPSPWQVENDPAAFLNILV